MGSNAIRLSTQMLSAIDFYAEKMGQGGDRQAVIQFLVDQYLKSPVYIDPLSEIELSADGYFIRCFGRCTETVGGRAWYNLIRNGAYCYLQGDERTWQMRPWNPSLRKKHSV